MKHPTRLVWLVHEGLISQRPAKHNARNVQTFQEELELLLGQELVQQVTAKNVVHLANISTRIPDYVDHADMDSSNPTRDHSTVKFADWVKRRDRPKESQELSAVTNVHQECNLELMESASHAREELIAHKEFNQHVRLVHLDEQHRRSDQQLSKNVHCQFVPQELTSTQRLMFASSAVKVSINRNPSKRLASPAHQITAPRTLPPHQRLNARILVKQQPRAVSTAIQMLIAFSFQKPQTSSVNANLDSMELVQLVWVRSVIVDDPSYLIFSPFIRYVRWFL